MRRRQASCDFGCNESSSVLEQEDNFVVGSSLRERSVSFNNLHEQTNRLSEDTEDLDAYIKMPESSSSEDEAELEDSDQEEQTETTRMYDQAGQQPQFSEDTVRFFEFEIEMVDQIGTGEPALQDLLMLKIHDVTSIVQGQKKLSDTVYQEAIQNNYSHEM